MMVTRTFFKSTMYQGRKIESLLFLITKKEAIEVQYNLYSETTQWK